MNHIITRSVRFMLLWALGSVVSLFTSAIVAIMILIGSLSFITAIWGAELASMTPTMALIVLATIFGMTGLAMGLVFGNIQKSILRGYTRDPWRGWIISSSIGGGLGVLAIAIILGTQVMGYFMMSVLPPLDILLWFVFQMLVIFFGCLGMCQMLALRQYVHGAWVWILANLVASIVFYCLIAFEVFSWAVTMWLAIGLGIFVMATPGIVTGFVMVWLINNNWRTNY